MQLVDGMDNASPLLNFVLGTQLRVSEIDVQSVELLQEHLLFYTFNGGIIYD
jgi:hypothetical protein